MRDDNGKFIKYAGVIFEVLNQISHKLNFTYSVHEPPDGKYGNEQSDGSYNGMIKQVTLFHFFFISPDLLTN